MVATPVRVYESQAALEHNLHKLLTQPSPLQRYEGMITWQSEPFPSLSGQPFMIDLPRLTGQPFATGELASADRS